MTHGHVERWMESKERFGDYLFRYIVKRNLIVLIRISTPCADSGSCQYVAIVPWWRHQMETFSALLALCEGNSPFPSEFLSQRPATRNFDVSFNLRLNKRLSKHLRQQWFKTRSLWSHCNAGNDMGINKRQTITRTNHKPVYFCIYASPYLCDHPF